MFSWFDATESKKLGESLAELVLRHLPVEPQAPKKKKKSSADKVGDVKRLISNEIDAFKRIEALNIYKKAQLGNAFRWRLKEAGYRADHIETLMSFILLRL